MKTPALTHSFLTIYIPVTFFAVMLLVLLNSVLLPEDIVIFPPQYVFLMLLTGISETLTGKLVHKGRPAPLFRRFRELFVLLLVSFFLVILLHGDTGGEKFDAGKVRIWVPVLFLAAQWLLGSYLHKLLQTREQFLILFADADALRLREIYSSYSHEAVESLKALRALKRMVITLTVLGFAGFTITSWILSIAYTGWALFLVLLFFVSFLFIIALLNSWRERQLMTGEGLYPEKQKRRFRMLAALLLVAAALLIAVAVTGTHAPLPASYLERFVSWLEELGRFEFTRKAVEAPAFNFGSMNDRLDSLLETLDPQEPARPERTARIAQIAGWVLLGIICVGICTYLLLPLFRGRSGGLKLRTAVESLRRIITESLDYLRSVRKRFSERVAENRDGRRKPAVLDRRGLLTTARREKGGGYGGATTAVHRNVLKTLYSRFVKLGERHGAVFSSALGPAEYASRVANLVPQCADECREIAGLFEEATYSNHDFEENLDLRLKRIVKKAIKAGRSRD